MKNSEQLEAIEAIRMVAPSDLYLRPGTNQYGHFVVVVEYGSVSETITLEGFNKLCCVKKIMNSKPVEAALR